MAENIPTPPAGAVPPKKETGKVQPKKETVRISLPPKPSAAPTIKMPAVPAGGPPPAPTAAPAAAPSGLSAAPPSVQPPAAPQVTLARATSAPAAAPKPGTPMPRQMPKATGPRTVTMLDNTLAIVAAVAGLAAVGSVVYLMLLLNKEF